MALGLGCSTILYGGFGVRTALERIAARGYTATELCAIPGMAPHIDADMLKAEIVAVKAILDETGLAVESIGGSGNVGDADRFRRLLDVAAAIGAPAVTTGPPGRTGSEEEFADAVRSLTTLGEHAKSVGVRISVKAHVGASVDNTPTALRLMGEVDAAAIGINWDPSHLWRAVPQEDVLESLRALKPHIATLRIRDCLSRDIPIGPVSTQVPGGGVMPLAELAAEMNTMTDRTHAVVEIVGTSGMALADVDKVVEDTHAGLASYFAS